MGAGCTSLPARVQDRLDRGAYEEARVLLDQAGVGEALDERASEKALSAREAFTNHIESMTIANADEHGEGQVDAHCEIVRQPLAVRRQGILPGGHTGRQTSWERRRPGRR